METQLQELRQLASRAENRRTETGIPRVAMVQGEIPEHQLAAVYDPMINLILTGSKTMTVGDRTFRYDPATYFVMSVDLPAVGSVHTTADGDPYLAVSLTLEPAIVANLLADLPKPSGGELYSSGFSVAPVTPELLDAWLRMLRLMERPDEIAALAPAYEREILFRVLQGPLGWMLRDVATPDTALSRIGVAIQWIRENFAKPLRVDALAEMAALSVSAFHRHFKAVTALSRYSIRSTCGCYTRDRFLLPEKAMRRQLRLAWATKVRHSLAGSTPVSLACRLRETQQDFGLDPQHVAVNGSRVPVYARA